MWPSATRGGYSQMNNPAVIELGLLKSPAL
jgi:hypothetical protein